jgi:hypothetical protein
MPSRRGRRAAIWDVAESLIGFPCRVVWCAVAC